MSGYYDRAKEAIEKVWSDKMAKSVDILEDLQGLRDELDNFIDMTEHDIEAQEEK